MPGLLNTVMAAATVPLDNYSFETLEALRAIVKEFNNEARNISACKAITASKERLILQGRGVGAKKLRHL